MTDKFTITREYDRDEIIADVQKVIDMGGDIYAAKRFLGLIYTGWNFDQRTSLMVKLMFRDETDMLHEFMVAKLAELDEADRVMAMANQFRL